MDPKALIHKIPKWGIYGAAGLGLGGIVLVYRKKKAVASGDATGMAQSTDTVGSPAIGPTGTSVIVPPVIIPPSNDPQTGVLTSAVSDLGNSYLAGNQSILNMFGDVLGSVLGQNQDITGGLFGLVGQQINNQFDTVTGLNNSIAVLAAAGPAPQPAFLQPEVVSSPAPAAPAAIPAPPAPDRCTGEFPFDAGGGDCFKIACASGAAGGLAKGRWHFHKNGQKVHVQGTC